MEGGNEAAQKAVHTVGDLMATVSGSGANCLRVSVFAQAHAQIEGRDQSLGCKHRKLASPVS